MFNYSPLEDLITDKNEQDYFLLDLGHHIVLQIPKKKRSTMDIPIIRAKRYNGTSIEGELLGLLKVSRPAFSHPTGWLEINGKTIKVPEQYLASAPTRGAAECGATLIGEWVVSVIELEAGYG